MCVTLFDVYKFEGRPALRCLLAPFAEGFALVSCLIAVLLLAVGGWRSLAGASWIALFEFRTLRASLRADSTGLVVTNRFVRHRISWEDVRGIWVPKGGFDLVPTVRIERRHGAWFSISVYATLGLRRERLREVALEVVALAREHGYEIVGGSEAEVEQRLDAHTGGGEFPTGRLARVVARSRIRKR
jgi:hypothetical protein